MSTKPSDPIATDLTYTPPEHLRPSLVRLRGCSHPSIENAHGVPVPCAWCECSRLKSELFDAHARIAMLEECVKNYEVKK